MTHDFISSHFILSLRGVSKCVFHAPGSLIKCRGSLVMRPSGIPDYFQNFPGIMLPEADSAQASRRCLSEFSSRSRVYQKSPDYMFRIRRFPDFSSPDFNVSSCVIHDSCSPSNHVINKHWEKQHHAVTSLFCRSLVACWTARISDAAVCFCQPSSVRLALNAVKLPLV